jgi:DNA (cytosine-5)-methyltransferase 1
MRSEERNNKNMPRPTRPGKSSRSTSKAIRGVDLFCGAGGLTHGLEKAGIDIAFGVDVDPACEYPFSANNKAKFLLKPVEELTQSDISEVFDKEAFSLLAGCAPCQPFSAYSQVWACPKDKRWNLLNQFSDLVGKLQPDLVTMENVPRLVHRTVFKKFVQTLQRGGYHVFYKVVNCGDYGVPQSRKRLVLLASKFGPIELIKPTRAKKTYKTVRQAIEKLPPLKAGEVCARDGLHQACELSALNLKRIRASQPGGSWRDWDDELVADCHKKKSGKTYPSVYGRMSWDDLGPTMTTQYFGFGNGRFGHPEQDRAISLREGAILQSFPKTYRFVPKGEPVYHKIIGRLIGNAVPVKLAEAIGKTMVRHVERFGREKVEAA